MRVTETQIKRLFTAKKSKELFESPKAYILKRNCLEPV